MKDNDQQVKPMSPQDLAKKIKAMETEKRLEALKNSPAAQEQKIHFDAWHALRGPSIPDHHMKEILLADFTSRGLKNKETIACYDAALEKYGVKLK